MNTINLLPLKQHPYRAELKKTKNLFYINLALSLFIILFLYVFHEININKINKKISQIKIQQTQQIHDLSQAGVQLMKIKNVQEKINKIRVTQDENTKLSGFLGLLPQAMPESLYLVNLSWHEHTGIIYGQADTNNTVIKFLNTLKNNVYFKQINLIKSDKRHEQDGTPPIYFVINFHEHD